MAGHWNVGAGDALSAGQYCRHADQACETISTYTKAVELIVVDM